MAGRPVAMIRGSHSRLDNSLNARGWCNTRSATSTTTVHQGNTHTHTHTFLCVHHILPRCAFHEHTRQLGPSSSHFSIYFFFCEHRSHIHEFTPLTVQMLGVVKQLKFWCRHTFKTKNKKNPALKSGSVFTFSHVLTRGEVHMKLCWVNFVSTCKCLSPPTSPPMHFPHIRFYFCDHRRTPCS